MKKTGIFLSLMLAVATASLADLGKITWLSAVGVYQHDPSSTSWDSFNEDAILNNYDVLWQLIVTPATTMEEAVIQKPDFSASNYLGGDEKLVLDKDGNGLYRLGGASYFADTFGADLALSTLPTAGTVSSQVDLTENKAYYMYQRIFQLEKGQTAPTEESWYWDSDIKEVKFDGKVNSVTFAVELKNGTVDDNTPIVPNLQVGNVPEPATMSLLGLGALAMALRRKLRK